MFRSATARLTLWYLVILMAVSLFFSSVLYLAAGRSVSYDLLHAPSFLTPDNSINGYPSFDFNTYRQSRIKAIQGGIGISLIEFNLVVLIFGGGASYLLARRTLRPIEEAMAAQSRFTSDASHELRTPLAVMRTELEVALLEKNLPPPKVRQLLKSNLEELKKLETLSAGLLRLAQYAEGTAAPEWQEVSLRKAVHEAAVRLEPIAHKRHITLKTDLPDISLQADEQSLTELFVILLDNAIKYGPDHAAIEFIAAIQGGFVVIEIADQADGIAAEDLPHVFDRFYRGSRSTDNRPIEGYGLGLALAKQIVELHRGQITVVSTAGEGSTFIIRLPLHQAIRKSWGKV